MDEREEVVARVQAVTDAMRAVHYGTSPTMAYRFAHLGATSAGLDFLRRSGDAAAFEKALCGWVALVQAQVIRLGDGEWEQERAHAARVWPWVDDFDRLRARARAGAS